MTAQFNQLQGLPVDVQAAIANGVQNWNDAVEGKILNSATTADGSLRRDDYIKIVERLTEFRQRELVGLSDLRSAGLVSSANITDTLVEVENVNEYPDATISMNGVAQQANQTTFASTFTPLPIYHSGWFIRFRQGLQYKNQTGMIASARAVLESQNRVIFNGAPEVIVNGPGGNPMTVYGYFTHPNRQTTTISDWTDLATNGDKIISDTLRMLDLLFRNAAVDMADSVQMYVADDLWTNLEEDYSTQKGDRTYLERLRAITQIRDVKPSKWVPAGNVALVQMTPECVEYCEAQEVTTVPHLRIAPTSDQAFTTYAAGVPVIKVDRAGKTGIVTASPV